MTQCFQSRQEGTLNTVLLLCQLSKEVDRDTCGPKTPIEKELCQAQKRKTSSWWDWRFIPLLCQKSKRSGVLVSSFAAVSLFSFFANTLVHPSRTVFVTQISHPQYTVQGAQKWANNVQLRQMITLLFCSWSYVRCLDMILREWTQSHYIATMHWVQFGCWWALINHCGGGHFCRGRRSLTSWQKVFIFAWHKASSSLRSYSPRFLFFFKAFLLFAHFLLSLKSVATLSRNATHNSLIKLPSVVEHRQQALFFILSLLEEEDPHEKNSSLSS